MNRVGVLVIPEKFLEALQKAGPLQLPSLSGLCLSGVLQRGLCQPRRQRCRLLTASWLANLLFTLSTGIEPRWMH